MKLASLPAQVVAVIHKRAPGFVPKMGIILGSGLGKFASELENPVIIPYEELPGFGQCRVPGHQGQLLLGTIKGVPIACFQGRTHFYEGYNNTTMQIPVRTVKLLGAEMLIITNAAGSLRYDFPTGSLLLINDHINLQFNNPLVGPNDDDFGPRFPAMEDAYNPKLRQIMAETAQELGIKLPEGIYIGVLGPNFETPAEIRAFQVLGADVVGMSTIAEVLIARHCDLKVVAISTITNMAAGLSRETLSHEEGLKVANQAMHNLSRLLRVFIEKLGK